jgi:hypothetical protein
LSGVDLLASDSFGYPLNTCYYNQHWEAATTCGGLQIPDAKAFLAQSLTALHQRNPSVVPTVAAQQQAFTTPELQKVWLQLKAFMQSIGLPV